MGFSGRWSTDGVPLNESTVSKRTILSCSKYSLAKGSLLRRGTARPFSTIDGEKGFPRKHSLAKTSPLVFFFSSKCSRSKGNLLRRGTARPLSTSDGEKGFSRRSSLFLSRLPSFLLPLLPLFLGAAVTSYCRIRYCPYSLLASSSLRSRKIRPGDELKVDAKILCQACRNFLSRPGAASAGERVRQGGQQTSPPIFSE